MSNESEPTSKRTWWNRRSRLEKWLLLAILLLFLLVVIIAAVKIITSETNVCHTQGCVRAASQILSKVDFNANPCDDFYKFACGNFIKNIIIPPSETEQNAFSKAVDLVMEQMRSVLEKPVNYTEPRYASLIKTVYHSCMNKTESEKNSLPYLQQLISNFGGWPVVLGDQWVESNFSWTITSYELMRNGFRFDFFFEFDVDADPANSSRALLHLDQPFTASIYKTLRKGLNESLVQAYHNFATKIAIAFGADPQKASEEMKEVVELYITIARILIPSEDRRDPLSENNLMTILQLENNYPYVPWSQYINNMLHPAHRMDNFDEIVVTVPKYFDKLKDVITKTPKRVIANYIFWKVVAGSISLLNEKIRDIKLEFNSISSGQTQLTPRWKQCVGKASNLDVAAGALYVKNFFKKESKDIMVEMVENIRFQFIETLNNLDWMDDSTRKYAIIKATTMQTHIGYPDQLLDNFLVENYYKNLTINPFRYFQTILYLRRFANQLQYAELAKLVDKKDWRNHADASVANAFYDQSQNSIEFPAGILQDEFFNKDRPNYMNYGAIGGIIGHEITHAFDDQGRRFDQNGNLVDWWDPKTEKAFKKRADCIVEQYGNFTVPEVNISINSVNTQGEDIADNGGVAHAYLAYKKWLREHSREKQLPGLPYTPEQMFWISLGTTWCEAQRDEQLKLHLMNEAHSPHYYRVNVPLMNSYYFAEDFNCPVGSFMNPEEKCKVW